MNYAMEKPHATLMSRFENAYSISFTWLLRFTVNTPKVAPRRVCRDMRKPSFLCKEVPLTRTVGFGNGRATANTTHTHPRFAGGPSAFRSPPAPHRHIQLYPANCTTRLTRDCLQCDTQLFNAARLHFPLASRQGLPSSDPLVVTPGSYPPQPLISSNRGEALDRKIGEP